MDLKYVWLLLAAISGGYVAQVRKAEELPIWKRLSHILAGAVCAVYFSPWVISYLKMADSDTQYVIPFAIGAFWWKFFEALEASVGSIKLPWGNKP